MNETSEMMKEEADVFQSEDDANDPIVKEIDVYLAKSLSNNIYILQYPIKPQDRNYENSKFISARIKPKQRKLELELGLDTNNDNYSRVKGEQFAINVDGKQTPLIGSRLANKQEQPQQKYFKSNVMDKQILTSTNATLGQMNLLYHLGVLNENKLHLTSIESIMQMKPSFDYFDLFDKKVKDIKETTNTNETDTSDDDIDKAQLVTLKYSLKTNQAAQQEQEQNWIPLSFNNQNDTNSVKIKEMLYCKNQQNSVKLDISNEEFLSRLVDNNFSESLKIEKTEKI